MNRKPVIGLNMAMASSGAFGNGRPVLSVPVAYADAVADAGGTPLCLPVSLDTRTLRQVLDALDGIVFIGGADYRPEHFDGHAQPESELILDRQDRFDFEMAKIILLETDLPVLGICAGCQLINLVLGGGLVQDIKTEWKVPNGGPVIPHSGRDRADTPGKDFRHNVIIEKDSFVARVMDVTPGEVFLFNSVHHQAVDPQKLGRHLRASAWSDDGIVEAIEPALDSPWAVSGRFVLGLQWHPERLQDEGPHRNIFHALIRAANRP